MAETTPAQSFLRIPRVWLQLWTDGEMAWHDGDYEDQRPWESDWRAEFKS